VIFNTNAIALSEGGIEQEHFTPPALDVVEHVWFLIFRALLEDVQQVIGLNVDLEPFAHDLLGLLCDEVLRHLMQQYVGHKCQTMRLFRSVVCIYLKELSTCKFLNLSARLYTYGL